MSAVGEPAPLPREGDLLAGRYRLLETIGRGGMGAVFDATDEKLGRTVAVKVPKLVEDGADQRTLGRFRREALAAARLGHTNIVDITDLRIEDGEPAFLVMEKLEGESLAERLQREGPLDPEDAVGIALQVLAALAEAHRADVVHRDVKPGNIFLVSLPTGALLVKLLDFGLAYLLEEGESTKLTVTGMTVGTPAFMAPERLRGDPVDPRSDVYSVAVCLHLAVHGLLPAKGGEPLRSMFEVDPLLSALIDRGLAADMDVRFEDAGAMASALQLWLDTAALRSASPSKESRLASEHPTQAAPVKPPPSGTRWAPVAALAFLGLMAAFVAWRVWSPLEVSNKAALQTAAPDTPPVVSEAPLVEEAPEPAPSAQPPAEETPEPEGAETLTASTPPRPPRPRRRAPSPTPPEAALPEAPSPADTAARSRPRPSLLEAPIEPDWSQARPR